jgi:rubrerythrin
MNAIRSAPELYAHAIAIEREAGERYAEFARLMADEGNDRVAAVFARLAALEAEHLAVLLRRTDGVALPAPPDVNYQWLDRGAPETAAHEFVHRLMTPHAALAIALAAEQRAQAFFESVHRTADDPALRALAQDMEMEEQEHIAMIERALELTPEQFLHSMLIFAK